jgi:Spy/CpxP family protein refolding chaperone
MKKLGMLALVVSLAVLGADRAQAQRPGGRGMGMMGGMGGMGALMSPAVQKELSLSDDQVEKVSDLVRSNREEMREKMGSFQDLAPEERREKMMAVLRESEESSRAKLKDVLKADQLKRYEEINLQMAGLNAFSQPDVAKKLKLTDEQKEKVASLESDLRQEMRDLREQNQGDFRAALQKLREKQDEAKDKVVDLLTDDQKATWKEMTGKPFERPTEGFGGRGRRNRNNDN